MKRALLTCLFITVVAALQRPAAAQGWPDVFDTNTLLTLNLDMNASDWQVIQADETFDIEVPALFWADGESPILVSVRRKSADPIDASALFSKVSLKIDINEYVDGQMWRDLRKLSLENGDDQDVVAEGLAWHLHRLAAGPEGYDFPAGFGSWVRVIINGIDTGVYVNAEQRDKRFLQNRGVWQEGFTWLFKQGDIGAPTLEQGEGPSPALLALCYPPFQTGGGACALPDNATLAEELPGIIDMQTMLTLGAVNTFVGNADALFNHAKNAFFIDYTVGLRQYVGWDLDSVFGGNAGGIYPSGSLYSFIIIGVPEFRAQYTTILNELLCGPMNESAIHAFLDDAETLLAPALQADVNSQIDDVAERFESLRQWISNRIDLAEQTLDTFNPCSGGCPEDTDGNGAVDVDDLVAVITAWGTADPDADVTDDGTVNVDDLVAVILAWGDC